MPRLRNKPSISISGVRRTYRDASLIIIACEGEKTEADYFGFSFFLNSRVKLCIIPSKDGRSAPAHVLENLKQEAGRYKLTSRDQLWVVVDTDRWPVETQLSKLLNARISRIPVQLAVSNPCFELFLYLHFADMPSAPVEDSRTMEERLRKLLGRYSKSDLIEEDYVPYIYKAVEEAQKTVYGQDGLPLNPGTGAGRLVKSILATCPVSERELKHGMPVSFS